MRIVAIAAAALVACAALATGDAQERHAVRWTHEGYKSLVEASAVAKKNERRLLVGLSGGDT